MNPRFWCDEPCNKCERCGMNESMWPVCTHPEVYGESIEVAYEKCQKNWFVLKRTLQKE